MKKKLELIILVKGVQLHTKTIYPTLYIPTSILAIYGVWWLIKIGNTAHSDYNTGYQISSSWHMDRRHYGSKLISIFISKLNFWNSQLISVTH